ncbi:MAG: hypothetical protein ABL949_16170 [Fimbriimonadaceae bacterium]
MKSNCFRTVAAIAASICTAISMAGSSQRDFLVGESKLEKSGLGTLIAGKGKIVGKDVNGFYRIAPLRGVTSDALKASIAGKIEFILPGNSNEVKKENLFSVRQHIRYLEAAYELRIGHEPTNKEETGVDFYEALEYYLSVRADPATGQLDHDRYVRAAKHRDQMPPATASMLDPGNKNPLSPTGWISVGPEQFTVPYRQYYGNTKLGGRKNAIAVAPTNTNIAYVASAGGGIWRSHDNQVSYQQCSDKWPFMHTTSVAIDPTDANTVYAGTGDYYGFFTRQTFGIMKSTDGGVTWTNQGAADFGDSVVVRIAIDPTNTQNVIALTAGPSGDIWQSSNGGTTWTATDAPDADWQDIDHVTSGFWIAVTGDGDRIYFSPNNGVSWTALSSPAGATGSHWDVACSKVDATRAYMITSDGQVYTTTDNYFSWTNITAAHDAGNSNPSYNWSQSTYDIYIETGINGTSDIIYTGLITISASDDNGATWNDISRSFETDSKWHNDQHNLQMFPTAGNWAMAVGDGGLTFLTYDATTNTASFSDLQDAGNVVDTQFYYMSVHPTNSLFVMGGTQDNASIAQRGALAGGIWQGLFAGDGAGTGFDLANPQVHYTSSQGGNFYRYDSDFDTTPTGIGFGAGPFITPLVMAGATGSTPVACSGSSLRVYSGAGTTWNAFNTGGGAIQSLAKGKVDPTYLFTGASNGDIYLTTNMGAAFSKKDGATLPNVPIGGMAASPSSVGTVLAALQGGSPGVWRADDVTLVTPVWTNVSGTGLTALPSVAVNDVERDPINASIYYAATDVGVFMSPDRGGKWYNMNAMGLPNVHVNDLWIYSSGGANFLYAATFGRGIWRCFLNERHVTQVQISKPAIYGAEQNTITVKINGAAPVGANVVIAEDSANVLTPAPFTFPIGATQYTTQLFTTNPASSHTVTVSATMFETTASSTFVLHPIPNFTYTPQSPSVYGGNTFTAQIDLGIPAPIATLVRFSDTLAPVASPTAASMTAGQQLRTVSLFTATVAVSTPGTISARISNRTVTTALTLEPRPNLVSVSCSPNPVQGGNPVTGTVNMDIIGNAGPQTVIVSDTSIKVTTPSSVAVPNGASSANFSITTLPVTANTNVTVRTQLRSTVRTTVLQLTP